MGSNCCSTISNASQGCCEIYSGIGTPPNSLGSNGAWYFDKSGYHSAYKKIAGTWVFQFYLQGNQGLPGANNVIYDDFSLTGNAGGPQTLRTYTLTHASYLANAGDEVHVEGIIYLYKTAVGELFFTFSGTNIIINPLASYTGQSYYLFYTMKIKTKTAGINFNIETKYDLVIDSGFATKTVGLAFEQYNTVTLASPATSTITIDVDANCLIANSVYPYNFVIKSFKKI